MCQRKALLATDNKLTTIDDHVRATEMFGPPQGDRQFIYELSDKATKAKLIKGAKRIPFQLEENSLSSNLVFSVGAWHNSVLPSIKYWNEIRSDQTCYVGDKNITIGGIKHGKEAKGLSIDCQIIFFVDREKVVFHFYNTTQLILVNGHGHRQFIDIFLKPFFTSKIESILDKILNWHLKNLEIKV